MAPNQRRQENLGQWWLKSPESPGQGHLTLSFLAWWDPFWNHDLQQCKRMYRCLSGNTHTVVISWGSHRNSCSWRWSRVGAGLSGTGLHSNVTPNNCIDVTLTDLTVSKVSRSRLSACRYAQVKDFTTGSLELWNQSPSQPLKALPQCRTWAERIFCSEEAVMDSVFCPEHLSLMSLNALRNLLW